MAVYKLNGKEVTKEEFNKQVFKAVEESPFFLDEIVSVSFTPKSDAETDEILNKIRKSYVKKDKTEEKLEDILKRNMSIGAPNWNESNTGGTVFEKVQNSTINPYSIEGQLKLVGDLAEKIKEDQLRSHKKLDWQEKLAKKETEGKLFYELDFEFIEQMAERMQSNKDNDKYEKWNWKKPMTSKGIEDLKQAMWRHIIAVMQGNYADDGRIYGHLEAISNNAMIINYQLKNK